MPIVENLSGHQESIFNIFRGPDSVLVKNQKKMSNFIKLPLLPLLVHGGPMAVWGPLGCCYGAVGPVEAKKSGGPAVGPADVTCR